MWDYLLNAAVTLFVAIDPVALAPLFIAVTVGRTAEMRRRIALRASLTAGGVLVGASLLGGPILEWLGISLSAFQIAGGLLLFTIASEMLFDRRQVRKAATAEEAAEEYENVAAFPLAVPLMAGPGAISATILIASNAPDTMSRVGLEVVIVAIVALALGSFLLADRVSKALRPTGRIVFTRLMGLLLAALSVQFVANGIRTLLAT